MRCWEPGVPYNLGDEVEYNGEYFSIVQPHISQGDWTPDCTPALWLRMEEPEHHSFPHPPHHEGHHPPPHQGGGFPEAKGFPAPEIPHGGPACVQQQQPEPPRLRALNELNSREAWITNAMEQKQFYQEHGARSPATWILTEGKRIPQGAVHVSREKTWDLYICRVFYEGSIQTGKASDAFQKGAVIGFGGKEVQIEVFEVLVGDMRGLRWVPASGRLDVYALGSRPVEGGIDADGTPLYVACAAHNGAVHPGKISTKFEGALIPYDNHEKCIHVSTRHLHVYLELNGASFRTTRSCAMRETRFFSKSQPQSPIFPVYIFTM
ncbi:hypothetical protein FISHEDRAFT_48088 [Fistulina hepatica ATCC 64428]|uniref:Chitin-binding type-3 domain-containing protein n=1 Tax=Fistulina hepatica ATCC 64428 TaxID=1128425 RepID=A0A0D7A565_9AGAR|nr:hypothetical protein FISHEDRAFT_48088 [Fistulina hepatica ATCC 64428]